MEPRTRPACPCRVVVLVLNWNRIDFTTACYRSLLRQDCEAELQIVVVDNGSTTHTPSDLQRACPEATVLALPENGGFAYGMNAGIREALNRKADFVWLLNNDTVCGEKALADLLDDMEEADVALVASRMTQATGEDDATPPQIIRGGSALRPPMYIPFPPSDDGRPPDSLCGASLLVRTEAIREVGPLDEGFPFFFEDADYSFRMKQAGWRIAETTAADVTHMGSATIGRMSRRKSECYRRGHVRFLRRHGRFAFPASLPPLLWRLFVDLLHLDGPAIAGSLVGWFRGWRDSMEIKGTIR